MQESSPPFDAANAPPDVPTDGGRTSSSADIPSPRTVDFLPSIVRSFAALFRLRGLRVSGPHLMATLGNSAPAVESCRRAAEEMGLNTTLAHRATLADISPLALPCLLLLSKDRTCVFLGMEDGRARVILPEHGHEEMLIDVAQLESQYTGNVVFGSVAPKADRQLRPMEEAEERRWFWDVVRHFGPLYRQVALISGATNLLVLIGPLFVMNVYDRVVPNLALETLWVLGMGAMLGYGFELALRSLRSFFTERASRNIDTIVATRIMRHILGMRLQDRPTSSGALMNHMREFDALREFCGAGTLLAFADLPFVLLFIGLVIFIGGSLALVPIVAMFALFSIVWTMQSAARRSARVQHQGSVEKSAHLVEMVTGIEAIKMASAENRMLQIWEKIVGHCAEMNENGKSINACAVNGSLFCTHVVSVVLIIWGVYLIGENKLTVGGLIACNILSGRIMSAVVQVASLIMRYQQVRISMKMLNKFMELPQERTREAANVDFGHLEHSLEFTQVSFTYEGMPLPAVRELSFIIPAGRHMGIMGAMGSGKSTLSKLMVGLYEPAAGTVRFGGVDLRQLDVVELRTRIGYMPQDPMLFHGTVRDNIALGAPHMPDQLILRAAWLAGVTDFVKTHPSGFGMQVGERGMNLSGGQRQAISLARALLHDPDIVILDEPTSNMDGITENYIKQRMRNALKGKTLIINMHRTSLLTLVDSLMVLKDGRVLAYGPKDEVLKRMQTKPGN